MILSDDEIQQRIESPINLLNRLRTSLDKTITPQSPCLPPKSADIIEDLENKISNTRTKAIGILNAAMDELRVRLPEVQKPERLAAIAAEMSKVVAHQDSKNTGDKSLSQIIVYAPKVQNIENYKVVEIAE